MTQWETRVSSGDAKTEFNVLDDADKWGKQGWKMVNVMVHGNRIYVYYQRPAQEPKEKAPSIEV